MIILKSLEDILKTKKIKKQNKLNFLKANEPLDITEFGQYSIGMDVKEIREYFLYILSSYFPNCSEKELRQIQTFMIEHFSSWCAGQTCGVGKEGQCLIYRWDIEAYINYYLGCGPTPVWD